MLNQSIWYNKYINIDGQSIKNTIGQNIFIRDFYDENNSLYGWNNFKEKMNLNNDFFFKWRQIISAIPADWKIKINNHLNENTQIDRQQHLLFISRNLTLDKLTSKQLYILFVHKIKKKNF